MFVERFYIPDCSVAQEEVIVLEKEKKKVTGI